MLKVNIEDKIVLNRFIVGLLYGVVVYAIYLLRGPLEASRIGWAASILVYYFTIPYIVYKYKPPSRFQVYFRGLATFYATWLLTSILLHELFRFLGVVE